MRAAAMAGLLFWAVLGLSGCERGVTEMRLTHAEDQTSDWLTFGRTYGEQHHSPLAQIDTTNVDRLGQAWEGSLENNDYGVEATPLEADGVVYVTSTWSRVFAFDARNGKLLWRYDPAVKREWLRQACCKAVNRGVALWKDKVYVGALDGRLIALDAKTGHVAWSADTTGGKGYYTITGAPRVVKGKVIIGNGGADFGTRGFFSAYDADTGALAWRFYVVPHAPGTPQESPALEKAVKTWDPKRNWSIGGGGNPWNAIAYDPDLDLLYVGTGNAGPYDPRVRNPGGGDQLYISSILAVKPETGELVWHYQTTPNDQWDFTATANMVLAEIKIGGRQRKVLMQAPKNGFFYVLDRATGELLSAEKYVRVNWADRVDLKTGRPVQSPIADYTQGRALLFPSSYGAHNWQPMAYSPTTGLVYIPAQDVGWVWDPNAPSWFYTGVDGRSLAPQESAKTSRGVLIGWDPKAGRAVWRQTLTTAMNGGVLVTDGGLLVQGTADGEIQFRDARDGKLLRQIPVGTGIVGAPISYAVGGQQYIAVPVGWNGVGVDPTDAPRRYDNSGRLVVLKLGGGPVRMAGRLPPPPPFMKEPSPDPVLAARGRALYQANCARCHGFAGEPSLFPDLRRMAPETYQAFDEIVLGGAYKGGGMASFADVLKPADTRAIRAYLAAWATGKAEALPQTPAVGARPAG